MAQVDYFLKIDGIKGESTDKAHKGEIEIESFSWGETNDVDRSSRSAGLGAGRVAMQDMHVTKKNDSASPLLMFACAKGDHLKSALLTCRKAGGTQQDYMKITLTDAMISSYQIGGSSGGDIVPTDQFSMNFAKIEFSFAPQDQTGKLGSPIKTGWDLTTNTKV
jgi:type VI secretion system secreted protein Hcp